jgi:hypothetical protein
MCEFWHTTADKLILRVSGKLHHIGTGSENARTPVLMLVQDLHVRIINAAIGELIRELVIDPARDYQPLGRRPAPNQEDPEPVEGSGSFLCPETGQCEVFTFGVDLGKRGLAGGLATG